MSERALKVLEREIVSCTRCPRLIEHCTNIAQVKRRAYKEWTYWGKPVPSFGDPAARLLIIGLAPAAHGANRTGRVFTGDNSGAFLYRVLWRTGFSSHPVSTSRNDDVRLTDAWITAVAHCAPPDNKPTPQEIAACRPFLARELELLGNLEVVVALGRIAFDNYLRTIDAPQRGSHVFGHDVAHELGEGRPLLISSYHPSQQNTSTGRLTEEMLFRVFDRARAILARNADTGTRRRARGAGR